MVAARTQALMAAPAEMHCGCRSKGQCQDALGGSGTLWDAVGDKLGKAAFAHDY
jgi:hypothetical protein